MSSRSRTSRLLAALVAVLATQLLATGPAAAAVPLPVAAVLTAGGQTALVVDLSGSTRPGRQTVTVTAGGVVQRAQLIPVMSAGLAVSLVMDTSAGGADTLPAWLSAGARFILEAPADCPGRGDRRPRAGRRDHPGAARTHRDHPGADLGAGGRRAGHGGRPDRRRHTVPARPAPAAGWW